MISNQMIRSFLKKHAINILIWAAGISIILLIGYFSSPEPEFIEEHGILTGRDVYALFIGFICYGLTSKKPFWKELTEDVETRVETCEDRLNALDTDIENIVTFADKKLVISREKQSALSLRIMELEEKVKTLSAQKKDLGKTKTIVKTKKRLSQRPKLKSGSMGR